MFSKEMENLIEATLADGVLTDQEKAVLVKRAQKEGIDLEELEIYIQSIMQKRTQNQKIQMDKETSAHEKERRGNICPHCGTLIPPMTRICPNCGQAVNANETSGDRELFNLIDKITEATVMVKSASTIDEFTKAKAECEGLMKKAELFYGSNQKVQMLVFDLKEEIKNAGSRLSSKEKTAMAVNAITSKKLWLSLPLLLGILALIYACVILPNGEEQQGPFIMGILLCVGGGILLKKMW